MSTVFAALLFAVVYGPVAYLIYRDLTAGRTRGHLRATRAASGRGTPWLHARSRFQH